MSHRVTRTRIFCIVLASALMVTAALAPISAQVRAGNRGASAKGDRGSAAAGPRGRQDRGWIREGRPTAA